MMRRKSFFLPAVLGIAFIATVFFGASIPSSDAQAAGLVPCGTGNTPPCTLCHLIVGVNDVIKWGMNVMTFFAVAIITAMGIVYIVSAGNSGMMSTAKNGIKSTLIGFAIMLGAWVIINAIMTTLANNAVVSKGGDWSTFTCDTTSSTQQFNQVNPLPDNGGGTLSCTTGKCAKKADVAAAVKNNASGLDPNILMAIIDGGEGCNSSKSPAGACGYSQVMPEYRKTVCNLTGSNQDTCAAMQNNLQLDINCGAKFIKEDGAFKKCFAEGGIKLLAACYNRGRTAALNGDCGEGSPPYCQRVESYYNSCPK